MNQKNHVEDVGGGGDVDRETRRLHGGDLDFLADERLDEEFRLGRIDAKVRGSDKGGMLMLGSSRRNGLLGRLGVDGLTLGGLGGVEYMALLLGWVVSGLGRWDDTALSRVAVVEELARLYGIT